MKKLLLIGLLTLASVCAQSAETTCAGGNGTVITGVDKKSTYCLGKIQMNWWSAVAWCHALGKELIDIQKDCAIEGVEGTTQCPNLTGLGKAWVWAQNVPNGNSAYYVGLGSGEVSFHGRDDGKIYSGLTALCR